MPHLSTIVAVAVVLGFMILIHEFGHYAAAKLFKVRVEVFSIGFGKRLFGFRRGETDYRIAAIPLGGYVKMSGENPMDERTGDPGEFLSHPRWQRFVIALAGPTMNILLAVALLTGVYMVHYERAIYADKPAVVGWVLPGSPAAKAGIKEGDRIIRIDGIEDPTWEQLEPRVALSPNQPLGITLLRAGQTFDATVTPEAKGSEPFGTLGCVPDQPNVITELEPGMPAEKAGLRVGDIIIAVNGQPVKAIAQMIQVLQQSKDQPVAITVQRGTETKNFTMTPVATPIEGLQEARYRVGIHSDPSVSEHLSFPSAFRKSLEDNKRSSFLILELVQKMIQRKVSPRMVEGPIGIGGAVGRAVREEGWIPLLGITAAISLNLGIFNLLPIPILDGGVILLLFIETLMQKDISLRIKERLYQAAFVFLVLFAVMVIYNDIVKRLGS
ncbi:MAG: RIP metalloprotease RseP [Acidobacteria bacterium]|jgi:regulator of sigma E protease|nr:MAG: RIP metalloprotease RseP [Acidobacteriota bacterium]